MLLPVVAFARVFFRNLRSLMSEFQFTQHVNPVTGKMEWKAQNRDDYDYFRDVARSSYADMLHDTERNQMYYKAIRIAVNEMHARGKRAKVLDIGTGTGLLSMMAANAGADEITAIEVFEPMAKVAEEVTKVNGFGQIRVINKHSTEVTVGEDMKEMANIIITELFDTELIGEGALEAYQHAHQNLVEEDCIAVPHSATTFVQLVESNIMNAWHDLEPIKIELQDDSVSYVNPDPSMKLCPGVPAVHDIQLSQVRMNQFKAITEAEEVFHFEWGSKALSTKSRSSVVKAEAILSGRAQVALSWWTLSMDRQGEIILSTAPYWHHPSPKNMQWRDHWIQSVYFLPKPVDVTKAEHVYISAYHDSYSLWFDATLEDRENVDAAKISRPACEYLPRMLWSRPRLGMLNDCQRNAKFVKAIQKLAVGSSRDHIALCVSDVTILPLLLAKSAFSKGHIYSLEPDSLGLKGIQSLVKHNGLENSITVINSIRKENTPNSEAIFSDGSINLLLGEPFFTASLLPWNDLRFWYARTELDRFLNESFSVMPCRANLRMAAVQFDDLWKIRAPVGTVEGFDVSVMDRMIDHALEMQEYREPEPHALWEYPCELLSEIKNVMTFNFTQVVPAEEMKTLGRLELESARENKTCHGVALWMEYDLDDEVTVSTGLSSRRCSKPEWNMHHKQAVFFLRHPISLGDNAQHKLDYQVSFIPETGEIKMRFQVG